MTEQQPLVSLDDARALVLLLEQNDIEGANQHCRQISQPLNQQLFDEVGKLTRQLHNSMADFALDDRISELANHDIPDAKERLNYVIGMTEQAANRTMDAVEESLPLAQAMQTKVAQVKPRFEQLMRRELELNQFKTLCHDVETLLTDSNNDVERLKELLNQVLLAQDFQDLTGQVIRKVIDLVREVELSLVDLLTVFGEPEPAEQQQDLVKAEGPIVSTTNRVDVVSGQDEVDDLLSSLGF
ncbi:protein phosphatase CheZ [Ferrimonas lipolytica]|uniref:Protein phosphatase CheZ n=1 Tax=Ferrimonas lipolytica TaxID=2724191 RepID=A0A6H1UFG2_9GAMM|nr:protein phosphatase CheZ [Ferrimonas lipolytica]QIZ77340.1 protein phosphatase CheZ [Ferrimonas lipolytica]